MVPSDSQRAASTRRKWLPENSSISPLRASLDQDITWRPQGNGGPVGRGGGIESLKNSIRFLLGNQLPVYLSFARRKTQKVIGQNALVEPQSPFRICVEIQTPSGEVVIGLGPSRIKDFGARAKAEEESEVRVSASEDNEVALRHPEFLVWRASQLFGNARHQRKEKGDSLETES